MYFSKWIKVIPFLLVSFIFHITLVETITGKNVLSGYFSENNLQGEIHFKKRIAEDIVSVTAFVETIQEINTDNVSWSIRQLPVDYTTFESRCSDQTLGSMLALNSPNWRIQPRYDLNSMLNRLPLNRRVEFSVATNVLSLTGSQGIWQSSIVLELPNGDRACSTLVVSNSTDIRMGKVKFFGSVFGTVYIFWIGITGSETDTVIITELYHVHKLKLVNSRHKWGLYVTDILESSYDKTKLDCNALQLSYNGLNDLSPKLGKLVTGRRMIYRDPSIAPIDLYQTEHTYYLAVYDDVHQSSFLSCATIVLFRETILKSHIEYQSSIANITLIQRSPFDPTWVSYGVEPVLNNMGGVRIHKLPSMPNRRDFNESACFGIKDVYNPTNKGLRADAPFPGQHTQNMYAIGDLSGKLSHFEDMKWDIYLPLHGPNSVLHRTVAFYKIEGNEEIPWLCGILIPFERQNTHVKLPITTAEVIFQYPISGRIIFRQLTNEEYADTIVIVESLLYSDGSVEADSFRHNWTINVHPPGKDYYDWQNRCLSAGSLYNPFKIPGELKGGSIDFFNYAQLASALGSLTIVARKARAMDLTRDFFIHPNLPISGFNSIVGKSFVIYDENGPKARGDRLACSRILPVNRRKAVVRDWFSNGEAINIMGDIEMYQMSEYDDVDVDIKIQGLNDVTDYHIHMVPVEEELQFPCENSTLYEIWDPLHSNAFTSYSGIKTDDQFKMGDLSGKYGDWRDTTSVIASYNDTNLSIFGYKSLLGRSFIVHKRQPYRRWACATIERGYSPSEAVELRAIASFHHPQGFVYGYIRMTQLVHFDGSNSDTVIEVNLRYPGKQNHNVTHNHFWLVYVNPVGVDATIEPKISRCTAAGYVWNPNFIQLAAPLNDDLYYQECGPDQPYRCFVGDLSGRLGTISIGSRRLVFSDSNLPLHGNVSIMGKSIVILDKNRGHDKFSCANIEPDKDIIKYANIRKPPKFVLAQFLTELREILGTPEWMLTVDNRKTKILHDGACVQLLFHFKGSMASEIELDFSKLLRTGRLASPTISNPGYITPATRKKVLNFQLCPARDTDSKRKILRNVAFRFATNEYLIVVSLSSLLIMLKHWQINLTIKF